MRRAMRGAQPDFAATLRAWLLRGFVCATPVVPWAVLGGYRSPSQLLAMLLGVVTISVCVAGLVWSARRSASQRRLQFLDALEWAPWLKLAWLVVGVLSFLVLRWLGVWSSVLMLLMSAIYVDVYTGYWITRAAGLSEADGLLPVFGVTLLQGLVVGVQLIVLASLVVAWRTFKQLRASPFR